MTRPALLVPVLAVLIAASLAGCAGSKETEAGPDEASPASMTVGTGTAALRVLVTDDSLEPLAGVTVTVQETSSSAITDDAGTAMFLGLEPGEYSVFAQRLGYGSAARKVQLDGSDAELRLQLAPLAIVEPYHLTYIFKGYMACGGGLVLVAFTACGNVSTPAGNVTVDPNDRTFFDEPGTPELKTVIGELVWQQTAALSARSMQLYLWQNPRCNPVCDPEHEYGGAEGPTPLYLRSDGPFAGLKNASATITHSVWTPFSSDDAPFVIVTLQQPFVLYSTHFFGTEAPEGFVARPDA